MQVVPPSAYDRAITVFSPEGRLYQVEYAREAVRRGTTAVGITCKDGVVLAVDRRITSKLVKIRSIEKIFQIDEHVAAATSGLVADARVLIDRARLEAQIYRLTYGEEISIEMLAKKICDIKQAYTQHGGVRPFGVSLLIAGIDRNEARLFETDPSGALIEYRATAIGSGRPVVMELLEKEYHDDISLDKGLELAIKSLAKANEDINPENVDVCVITVKDAQFKRVDPEEVKKLIEDVKSKLKQKTDDEEEQKKEKEE
ncbi:proteasome endopeptidase complex, alpha subunit [Methanocaldococcus vulcanius M7]|uniref:Proteasome subunit alpha n=1 Tax=Methanocaldococcus vulcanius (strain ATCC 700851 / DSM 12094 / M7) TaxID=579137 RepID=C9RDR9_METVM|nr:archaeal proteasome endopeptidase complex subunit alpha [Methanocaldococcus vulcanius]ACX73448.1 proteasome endopeptidase complex, alpha subunit [Methanocaldococcus vulcanius M7]